MSDLVKRGQRFIHKHHLSDDAKPPYKEDRDFAHYVITRVTKDRVYYGTDIHHGQFFIARDKFDTVVRKWDS